MARLLVLTPLAIEHTHLLEALQERGLEGALDLTVGGHGKVQFALATQLMIQKFAPRLVVCAGAAGSLQSAAQPLDIVVGEVTIEHDFKLHFVKRPLPRFPGDAAALELLRVAEPPSNFKRHFGALASGDEDIIDVLRAEEIRKATQALAVAWEGAGAARACKLHSVPFLEIRVITDMADANAVEDFSNNLRMGMKGVAETLACLL